MGMEAGQRLLANPTPEFTQAMEKLQAAELPDDPLLERATEQQKNAWLEAQTDMIGILAGTMQKDMEETLTQGQMLQVRKLEMQLMPEIGIPFPSMFDPLDLTDDQKKEMNKITDEMKAEYDRLTQEAATLKAERLAATYQSLQGKVFTSQADFDKALQDVHRQYVPSEEILKKYKDLRERGTKFTTLLQTRLMDVLTDEQLDKMAQILAETPKFIKKVRAEFQANQKAQQKLPTYVPGPDSWRPGDPVPEKFKEERKAGRFPRSSGN